jgi:hypothetical protein
VEGKKERRMEKGKKKGKVRKEGRKEEVRKEKEHMTEGSRRSWNCSHR